MDGWSSTWKKEPNLAKDWREKYNFLKESFIYIFLARPLGMYCLIMRTLSPHPHPFFFFFFFSPKNPLYHSKFKLNFFLALRWKNSPKNKIKEKKKPPKNRKELYQKDIKGKREGRGGGAKRPENKSVPWAGAQSHETHETRSRLCDRRPIPGRHAPPGRSSDQYTEATTPCTPFYWALLAMPTKASILCLD